TVPPPKPESELRLTGHFRRDRHAGRGDPPPASGAPKMPRGLSAEAAKFWRAVVPPLVKAGVLKELDTFAVQAAAEMWARYRAALALSDADPANKNLRVAVANYLATWERLAGKLGLTP